MNNYEIVIRRSARRKKTIQAKMEGNVMMVMAPATISNQELDEYIFRLRAKMAKKKNENKISRSDSHLNDRARYLNQKYFNGTLSWNDISYSQRQTKRYGSCTSSHKTIRISSKTKELPQWVEDYVIVHEMAHLLEPHHGKNFWKLVRNYPLAERAIGFLMALDTMNGRK